MTNTPVNIKFNPNDHEAMCNLMDKYGKSDTLFFGRNTILEEVTISIYPEKIITSTYQHDGWVRRNTYWRDGAREETFDGRWKTPGNMEGNET